MVGVVDLLGAVALVEVGVAFGRVAAVGNGLVVVGIVVDGLGVGLGVVVLVDHLEVVDLGLEFVDVVGNELVVVVGSFGVEVGILLGEVVVVVVVVEGGAALGTLEKRVGIERLGTVGIVRFVGAVGIERGGTGQEVGSFALVALVVVLVVAPNCY